MTAPQRLLLPLALGPVALLAATLAAPATRAARAQAPPIMKVQRVAPAAAEPPAAAPGGELPAAVFAGVSRPATATAAAGATAPAASAEAARKAQRLQRLQQFAVDRRPSAVLRAWANPDAATPPAAATLPPGMPPTATATATPDPLDADLRAFQRNATLGEWPAVKAFLAKLPADEGKLLYRRLLESVANPQAGAGRAGMTPEMMAGASGVTTTTMTTVRTVTAAPVVSFSSPVGVSPSLAARMAGASSPTGMPGAVERPLVTGADVVALAGAAPAPLDDPTLGLLANLARLALEAGNNLEDLLARLKAEAAKAEGAALSKRQAAELLLLAGRAAEAGAFLPTLDEAVTQDDREALNLLARHFLAQHAKDRKAGHLERAWAANQAVLAAGAVPKAEADEALTRAVELAPQVRADLGARWLAQSFTERPERGKEILAAIGTAAAGGLATRPFDTDFRARALKLQKTAVEALVEGAPDRADAWREPLTLLAVAWLGEADLSQRLDRSTALGPIMQRDPFGNIFFVNGAEGPDPAMMSPEGRNQPRPIPTADVLEARPGDGWLARVDPTLRPRFAATLAKLRLKVGDEAGAFPAIESLAATHPEAAKELAAEFLRVWTQNHDPNAARSRTSSYMFMYGFERRAEGIPLTRSKQERNLADLAGWAARLRALPGEGLVDETLLARAFTTAHSAAEVYRIEAIEAVFGDFDRIKPEAVARLVQQMRGNLVGAWRTPAVQEQAKTKRREGDIRAEVLRGYEVARAVTDRALEGHPDHWALLLARAAVAHDELNYRQDLDASAEFAGDRRRLMGEFARAAASYARVAAELTEDEQTTEPFEQWLYASLGASDLNGVAESQVPDPTQPAKIGDAIRALPGAAAERHLGRFANNLFTRISAVNPAVKARYLKAGFEVVGDHPQAREARKLFDYYRDLVTEIGLVATVDGPTTVGHGEPFGVFVDLRHTRDLERESGGFAKYLQNQNAGGMTFYYNYGRPLENYRDKFEEAARKALAEHFDVLSVTFQPETVNSRATREYGWRVTPYAYLLLKARDPKVDRLPPLRLDLDFLDTSGYVVLPVESPAVPLDCAPAKGAPRPFEKLALTQTLDERQAAAGKLVLEVKATARGLVPPLEALLDVKPEGFAVAGVEDQGLSVAKFDDQGPGNAVLSERTWTVALRPDPARPAGAAVPAVFRFPAPKVEDAERLHQRYVDADLEAVGPEFPLERRYERPGRAWIGWTLGAAALGLAGLALYRRARSRTPRRVEPTGRELPDPLTPFTVLGLLRDIRGEDGLSEPQRRELAAAMSDIERHYFAGPNGSEPDLRSVAERWVRRVR
jgi:hypothetical protein